MRMVMLIAMAAFTAAPAIAQWGVSGGPLHTQTLQEMRREADFFQQQRRAEIERERTRDDVRRGMDDRDPTRGANPSLPPRERFGADPRR